MTLDQNSGGRNNAMLIIEERWNPTIYEHMSGDVHTGTSWENWAGSVYAAQAIITVMYPKSVNMYGPVHCLAFDSAQRCRDHHHCHAHEHLMTLQVKLRVHEPNR